MTELIIAFGCAVCSFVYCIMLTEENMLLNGWYHYLEMHAMDECERRGGKIDAMRLWWFKVLIGCERCNCGQLTMWIYLYHALTTRAYITDPITTASMHVFIICLAIFFISLIKKIYQWTNQ